MSIVMIQYISDYYISCCIGSSSDLALQKTVCEMINTLFNTECVVAQDIIDEGTITLRRINQMMKLLSVLNHSTVHSST